MQQAVVIIKLESMAKTKIKLLILNPQKSYARLLVKDFAIKKDTNFLINVASTFKNVDLPENRKLVTFQVN